MTSYQNYKAADKLIEEYIADYLRNNRAAKMLSELLDDAGVGLRPLVDHITIRTADVETRAMEFLQMGFIEDLSLGVVEHDNWWAKVYRRPGLPAIFIDQAFEGERGTSSIIPAWVEKFGDRTLHHVAVSVSEIEHSMSALSKKGIAFSGEITGDPQTPLRQIFTKADMKDGLAFTVLELAERRWGYTGFHSHQANTLMESTR
ncbi:MAG: hypothetical protein IAF08_08465 [Rhizobacter sp.]|nr:hypothetical protein [Chlorobiales bacterium]